MSAQELTELVRDDVWKLWNMLPSHHRSPVKAISFFLDLPFEIVAGIVYPEDQGFDEWIEDDEPDF